MRSPTIRRRADGAGDRALTLPALRHAILRDELQEVREIEWLLEPCGGANSVGHLSNIARGRRHHDDGRIEAPLGEQARQPRTIQLWHVHIEQHERWPPLLDGANPFETVRGPFHRVASGLQQLADRTSDLFIVIDNEDRASLHHTSLVSLAP